MGFALITAVFIGIFGGVITAWIPLTVFALLSCYTQYFAAVAAVVIYGVLGLYFLIKKRLKCLGKLIISGLLVVIGYAPWIGVLFRQITAVESDKNTIHVVNNSFSDYFEYFITQSYDYHIKLFLILSFMLLLILSVIAFVKKYHKNSIEHYVISAMGAMVFFTVILFGLLASFIGNPILLPRYLFMSLLPLMFSFGDVLSKGGKRIVKIASFILTFMIIIQSCMFCAANTRRASETKKWREMLISGNELVILVENYAFGWRIIKQITGLRVEVFIEEKYSSEYKEIMEKYKKSTVELFDKVVYGDNYKLNESENGEFLLNEVKSRGTILVVLRHPEIARDLSDTGQVKAEKIGENDQQILYRLTYVIDENGVKK